MVTNDEVHNNTLLLPFGCDDIPADWRKLTHDQLRYHRNIASPLRVSRFSFRFAVPEQARHRPVTPELQMTLTRTSS